MKVGTKLAGLAAAVWLSGCGGAEGPEPAGSPPPAAIAAAVHQAQAGESEDGRKHRLNVGGFSALQAERLFAMAESNFAVYFPGPQATSQLEGWAYRYYPRTGVYLAVIGSGIYVLGGPFGAKVTAVGPVADFVGAPDGDERRLTALQQLAEGLYRGEGLHIISTYLPSSGRPFSGNYAYSVRYAAARPLSTDNQQVEKQTIQLGSTLMPRPSSGLLIREFRMVDGRPVPPTTLPSEQSAEIVRLSGDTVVNGGFAADGVTLSSEVRLTGLTRVPLSGLISDSPEELRRADTLAALFENSSLMRRTATWAPGSAYFRRSAVYHGERLVLQDCPTRPAASGEPLTSCASNATLESRFPLVANGATYALADGVIERHGEYRVWVANRDEPGPRLVGRRAVLAERNGEIYRGTRYADGALLYGQLRPNVTVDFTPRFNDAAVGSLRAAVTF